MRPACSLLALAGCNAIFGLNDNAKIADTDAVVFPDGELMTFKLRYRLADTVVIPPDILNEPAPIAMVGIAGVTDTRVGAIDGELFPAPYDPETGEVGLVLPSLLQAPWRFRYTLDGVEHELQWQPDLGNAKASEPMIGRLSTEPPPADSGYNIQPTGAGTPPIGGYNQSRVFTTGVFLDIRTGTSPSSTQLDGTANKTFLGKLGAPESSRGDNAVLVNYAATSGMCGPTVNGYAHFTPIGLVAGTKVPITPAPMWRISPSKSLSVAYANLGELGLAVRLASALSDSSGGRTGTIASGVEHGLTASTELPGTVVERPVTIGNGGTFTVPGPHMLMLAQCPLSETSFSSFLLPFEMAKFPRVTHGFVSDRRSIGGVELVSSVVAVDALDANNVSNMDFSAPLAVKPITLTSIASMTDLSEGSDTNKVSVASPLTLQFGRESDQAQEAFVAKVDYFEITVFQIANNALTKKRVFVSTNVAVKTELPHLLANPIPLDLSGLLPGTYVLRIRAVAGAPDAALGNFETVAYPYSAASVFTRAFEVL